MAKPAKKTKTTKKPTTLEIITVAELEQTLYSSFDDLVKNTETHINKLSKDFEKVRIQLGKGDAKKKKAKDKRVTLIAKVKVKPTPASDSQLEKAKAAYEVESQAVEAIKTDVKKAQDQLKSAKLFRQKLAALSKDIDKFNKAWEKKQAPAKKRKKSKASKAEIPKTTAQQHKGRPPKEKQTVKQSTPESAPTAVEPSKQSGKTE